MMGFSTEAELFYKHIGYQQQLYGENQMQKHVHLSQQDYYLPSLEQVKWRSPIGFDNAWSINTNDRAISFSIDLF